MRDVDFFYKDFGHQISLLTQTRGGSIYPEVSYEEGPDYLLIDVRMPTIPAILFFCTQEPGWLFLGVCRWSGGKEIDQLIANYQTTDRDAELRLSIAYRDGGMRVKILY